MLPLKHPGNAVIQKAEDEEEVIKAGEDNEEVVEGVLHVLRGEDVDGEAVTEEAEHADSDLAI